MLLQMAEFHYFLWLSNISLYIHIYICIYIYVYIYICIHIYIYHIFTHSSIGRDLHLLPYLAIVNNVAMNIEVHESVFPYSVFLHPSL